MKLSYAQARECTYIIYTKRGYKIGQSFIGMLHNISLISLNDRSELMTMITSLEEYEIKRKEEMKFMAKIKRKAV